MQRIRSLWARPATVSLLAVCVGMFLLLFVGTVMNAGSPARTALSSLWMLDDPELMQEAGGLVATRVWLHAEWWRVVSAGLLHQSWLHLGVNMLSLWAVGQWTEKAWGWWRQLLLFGVSSVGGCLASLAWAEAGLVVGASAGIFGVAGALVVGRAWGSPETQRALEPVSARVLGFFIAFWLLVGFALPWMGVSLLAQAGHVGGLAFGSLLGWQFSRPPLRHGLRLVAAGGAVLGLLGVASLAAAPRSRPNYHVLMGSALLNEGEFVKAAQHFDQALKGAPGDPVMANAVAYSLAEAGVELDKAEGLVLEALALEPENADYLDTLGWIQCKQGRTAEGETSLASAQANAEQEIAEIAEHMEACADVAGR